MLILDDSKIRTGLFEDRILVTGVRGDQLTVAHIEDAQPYRDEHLLAVFGADQPVDLREYLRRAVTAHALGRDNALSHHHEHSRRDTLAGYVGDHYGEMIVINKEEIVEVAAHLFGGDISSIDIELVSVGERREDVGQHIRLYLAGERELGADALLLGCDGRQIFLVVLQIALHILYGEGEVLYLVAGMYIEICKMLGLLHACLLIRGIVARGLGDGVDRLYDRILHKQQQQDAEQGDNYPETHGVLQDKQPDVGDNVLQSDVGEDIRGDLACFGSHGHAGGAYPSVVFGVAYIIEHTRAVPVEELLHTLAIYALPCSRLVGIVGIGVDDIDQRVGAFVIHSEVDIIDVA